MILKLDLYKFNAGSESAVDGHSHIQEQSTNDGTNRGGCKTVIILKIEESEIMCKTEPQNEEREICAKNGNGEDEAFNDFMHFMYTIVAHSVHT